MVLESDRCCHRIEPTKMSVVPSFRSAGKRVWSRIVRVVVRLVNDLVNQFPLARHTTLEGVLLYDETQYVVDRIDEISRYYWHLKGSYIHTHTNILLIVGFTWSLLAHF